MNPINTHRSEAKILHPRVVSASARKSDITLSANAKTTSTRRRSRSETHRNTMKRPSVPVVLVLFSLFFASASSFQVSATKTHSNSGSSSSRTTLSSASAGAILAPPAHHLEWLKSLEDKKSKDKQKSLQQSVWHLSDFDWLHKEVHETEEIPLEAVTDFNDNEAKDAWAARYASVEALRRTFGRNKNVLWGDLDAVTTRRLYKTLLPRALLELYHCHGASSEDLAPLAYRARVAAKLYARERSTLPTRLGACLFDGIRQFRKYGSFQVAGMTYDQIWEKYAKQVMQEEDWEDEDDLTSKICYKILQKSCESNSAVDAILLQEDANDLQEITRKLEKEVFNLIHDEEAAKQWSVQRFKTLKTLLRIKRRLEHIHHHGDHHHHYAYHHGRYHSHNYKLEQENETDFAPATP
mmetsp:Transcript_9757/g.18848  ORF Transcript_9757/g.18848 Transcript_9757/m.18848 type:complete len:410 (-) Transcript_9757:84-1313(-)